MVVGANEFANKSKVNVTLLMDGGFAVPAFQNALDLIRSRKKEQEVF